jgi:hypothetical protein
MVRYGAERLSNGLSFSVHTSCLSFLSCSYHTFATPLNHHTLASLLFIPRCAMRGVAGARGEVRKGEAVSYECA